MVFKTKTANIFFWIIFGLGFALLLILAIIFDNKISSYIFNNNINDQVHTSAFNEVFATYGGYIVSVPIYVGLLSVLKVYFSKVYFSKGIQITLILMYDLIFLLTAVLLTFKKVWLTTAVDDFLVELVSSCFIYAATIFTIVLTNLILFTKKIIKHEFDNEWLLQNATYCLVFVMLSLISIALLKQVFGRPRPFRVFEEGYDFKYAFEINFSKKRGVSFPSGHTTGSITFFGLMFFAKKDTKKKKIIYLTLQIVIGILATLTAISRILYLKHYLSDVLVATLMCSLYIIFTKAMVNRVIFNRKTKQEVEVNNG